MKILDKKDPLSQMELLDKALKVMLLNNLKEMRGLKFNIGMEILFEKLDNDGTSRYNSFTFTVKSQSITNEAGVSSAVHAMNQNIIDRIDRFTKKGIRMDYQRSK